MKKLLLFFALTAPLFASCPAGTIAVTDTLYGVDGLVWNGTISYKLTYNTTAAGRTFVGQLRTLKITSGVLDICLTPGSYEVNKTTTATATAASYSVASNWVIPTTGGPYSLSDVPASVVNTSGTAVAWVSGVTFASVAAKDAVLVNGTAATVSRVTSSTALVLTASVGAQTGVSFSDGAIERTIATPYYATISGPPGPAPSGTGVVEVTDGVPGLVSGTASDCVKVDGSSGACGSGGGATIPSVSNLIAGDGAGNGADSGIAANSVVTLSGAQSLTNKTVDGVSPATMGYLDATSSVQTQLNAKQAALSGTWNQIAGTPDKATGALSLRRMTLGDLPPLVAQQTAVANVSSWTSISVPSGPWGPVAYSPELRRLVAMNITANGGGAVMTSDDAGRTWTQRTTPGDAISWNGVAWSPELSLFVALPHGTSAQSLTSPDGIIWTLNSVSVSVYTADTVIWASSRAEFCAVSANSSSPSTSMHSSDGFTWTAGVSAVGQAVRRAVWAQELGLYVGTGEASGLYTSPDCSTWTLRTAPAGSSRQIAWSPQLGLLVATGASGYVATSADGITWTQRTSTDATVEWRGLSWSPQLGIFAALDFSATNKAMYSADGITWTALPALSGALKWNNTTWVPELGKFIATTGIGSSSVSLIVSRPMSATALAPSQLCAQVTNCTDQTGSYTNPSWITSLAWAKLTSVPSTFAPSAHAASHQNGGSDEIATATPGANSIPKAGAGGTLASGWIPTLNQNTTGNAATATALAANPTDCSANQYATAIAASGNLTCAQVAYSQVSGTPSLATVATTGSASDLTTGTLAAARGGAGTISGALKGNGSGVVSQAACADLSNAAASCSTDATNAGNIGSGTLPSARLATPIRAGGFSVMFRGSDAAAGTTLYLTVPYACTITDWAITGDSTATIKLWRVADGGTALPTVSNTLSTSGFSLATGTRMHSTTLTDLSSTAIAAYDTFGVNLFASASTSVEFTLGCQR